VYRLGRVKLGTLVSYDWNPLCSANVLEQLYDANGSLGGHADIALSAVHRGLSTHDRCDGNAVGNLGARSSG
jgi:hypothetical protein